MTNVNGKWTGVITFGKEYGEFESKELYFDMELVQQNEIIKGSSNDLGGFGASPDKASIEGTLKENVIEFIKQYARFHYYKNGETKIDKLIKGKEIHYVGNYDETTKTFSGDWVIRINEKLFGFIPINYKNTGMWTMKRK